VTMTTAVSTVEDDLEPDDEPRIIRELISRLESPEVCCCDSFDSARPYIALGSLKNDTVCK